MKKPLKRFLVLAVIVGAIASCSIAWSTAYPSGTWRYKITVSVDTPEGVKTGSAVREITISRGIELTPETTPNKKSRGEAVVVDLGKRGVIFLTTSYDDYQKVFESFPFPKNIGAVSPKGLEYYSHLKDVKADLKQYRLVTFTDINNPLTAKIVASEKIDEFKKQYQDEFLSFQEAFGEGVKLKDVTIEMTDEPVTNGIVESYLPWLRNFKGGYLHGKSSARGERLSLDRGNFEKGD